MIYTLFIHNKQKDYTNKRRAYAVAKLFNVVVFTRERYLYTLEEVLNIKTKTFLQGGCYAIQTNNDRGIPRRI